MPRRHTSKHLEDCAGTGALCLSNDEGYHLILKEDARSRRQAGRQAGKRYGMDL